MAETTKFHTFTKRLKDSHKTATKLRARYISKLDRSVSGYIHDLLWEDAKIRVLDDVINATKSKTASVDSIKNFALSRLLAMATSRHANCEEMAAWALVVDLANPIPRTT